MPSIFTLDAPELGLAARIACPMLWEPVYGSDGRLYDNACMAHASGVTVVGRPHPLPPPPPLSQDSPILGQEMFTTVAATSSVGAPSALGLGDNGLVSFLKDRGPIAGTALTLGLSLVVGFAVGSVALWSFRRAGWKG